VSQSMQIPEEQAATRGANKLARPAIYAGLVIILALFPLVEKNPYILHIFIITFIYIVATVSLRLVTISGQYPLAHAAFMGIGGYISAVIAKQVGWPLWVTIPMGGVTAMAVGALIAFPFARLRAFYYAMVSLFFGIGVTQVIIVLSKWTSGSGGLVNIPHLLPTASKVPYYYFFLGFMVVCALAMWRFEFCRIGLSMKAIAQSHLVAASVGISEVRYRILALSVGCFFVGITGAVYAHYNYTLSPTSFDFLASMWLFIYALVGGLSSFGGPIVGTALLIIVPQRLSFLKQYLPFISAAILLVIFYVMHDGLISLPQLIKGWYKKR
jgi:branched-chain amino acid transport system permease protein